MRSQDSIADEFGASRERVLTLVFTDLAGSTALKSELGDRAVAGLLARHRAHIEQLAAARDGRVIDWAGDGCFLTFETSSAAVLFALALQQVHATESDLPGVRIGVHLGEITESSPRGGGATRVEGLAVDLAARVCSLARPSQVLMSSFVFNNVRQRIRGENLGIAIAWRAHGPYELNGFDDPFEICEAGIVGIAPLEPPVGGEKAHRAVTPGEEDSFGWRPAVGLNVQRRDHWVLEEQLGQGGFGEVWLAVHAKTRAKRVFKFCFEPERVRALKREVVLFRLLKETLGNRTDIAQIVDWDFEHTPYFIESEYTEGGDLRVWAAAQGGLDQVPLGTRLELIAQVAVALAAAHSVGVLHKDIKPANVLISDSDGSSAPRVVLTDFGIGLITDPAALAARGITAVGLTLTLSGASTSETGAGTRLYVAPELLEGKPATTLSDIYSVGVVLYQMVIGDFTHAIGTGWERDVADELLREDMAACLDGDPARRLRSAGELAERLRTLKSRRAERHARREIERQAEHTRRRRRQLSFIVGVVSAIAIMAGLFSWQLYRRAESERGLNLEAQAARSAAEQQLYYAQIQLAASQIGQGRLESAILALENSPAAHRNWEWGYLVHLAFSDLLAPRQSTPATDVATVNSAELWRGSRAVNATSWREHATEINMIHLPDEGTVFSVSDDGTLRAWDLVTGKLVRTFGDGNDALFCVDYHAGTDRVTAAGFDGILYVWDAKTGNVLCAEEVPASSAIFDVAIDPAGRRIYTASTGMVGVFDLEEKAFLKPFGCDGVVSDLAIDAEGRRLTAVSLNGHVMSWDAESRVPGTVVRNPGVENSTSAIFSPGLDLILSGLPDGNAVLWDARTGDVKCKIAGKVPPITHVASFSPDSAAVAVPDGRNGAAVYETETGVLLARLEVPDDGIRSVAFHPKGRQVLVGGVQGTLRVWEPASQDLGIDSNVLRGHTDTIYFAAFSPDGRRLASASFDHTVRVWDVETGRETAVLDEHPTEALHATFSTDGRYLRTQGTDHTVRVWDAHRFDLLHTIVADPEHQWAIASQRIRAVDMMGGAAMLGTMIDPSSSRISVNLRDSLGIYDCASGKQVADFHRDGFRAGFQAFSPDGRIVVSTSTGTDVWAIDAATGSLLHQFEGHTGPVTMPSVSPDGRRAVTGSFDKSIRVWDLINGGELRKFEGHQAFVVTARFDASSTHVLSSSGDGTARIWDIESGKEVARLSGHGGMLINADYSPRGDRILTYGWDNTAKVWDTSGRELVTIPMPKGIVHGIWSPDGHTLALSGTDGRLHLVRALPWENFGQEYNGEHWLRNAIAQWVQERE